MGCSKAQCDLRSNWRFNVFKILMNAEHVKCGESESYGVDDLRHHMQIQTVKKASVGYQLPKANQSKQRLPSSAFVVPR